MSTAMSPSELTWSVSRLCRAVADALDARFNPVRVRGEVSGFSKAASGHCYFSLKDEGGQIRCAMFKRAAGMLDFSRATVNWCRYRAAWACMRRAVTCS